VIREKKDGETGGIGETETFQILNGDCGIRKSKGLRRRIHRPVQSDWGVHKQNRFSEK